MSVNPGTLNIHVEGSPSGEVARSDAELESVIQAFLDVNPTPTDEEIHLLARMLGLTPEQFEEVIYRMFSVYVNDPKDRGMSEAFQALTLRDQPEDPIEELLVKYFVRHPEPSDAQIHDLAKLIGFTPEALEERLFSLLSELEDINPTEPSDI